MASNHRAARWRRDRAEVRARHRVADQWTGVQPGWFLDLDALEEAKTLSHDLLIESMGDRRTGGVSWRWWPMPEAKTVLAQVRAEWPPGDQYADDVLRRIGAHLREYGGYLIVAQASGRPPDA